MAADASHTSPVWVASMGGPLAVVPVSVLAAWGGCTEPGMVVGDATALDDYDRACAVEDLAGVITVGEDGAQALVLADEPATSCYLPEHRAFLRWLAADSAAGLKAAAETVLADPTAEWEECGVWVTVGQPWRNSEPGCMPEWTIERAEPIVPPARPRQAPYSDEGSANTERIRQWSADRVQRREVSIALARGGRVIRFVDRIGDRVQPSLGAAQFVPVELVTYAGEDECRP